MKASAWIGISFGATLGLVVGLRLNAEGLLLVATLLLGALLLFPLFALRWLAGEAWEEPDVCIERPPAGDLGGARGQGRTLLMGARAAPGRRGGWPFLGESWAASEGEAAAPVIQTR